MANKAETRAGERTKPAKGRKRARRRPADALSRSAQYNADESDSAPPQDIDVFRYALTRRIRTLLGDPRRCREPVCRRTRRCAGPDLRCARDFPAKPVSDEQWSKTGAELLRALSRRAAELGL